MSLYLEISACDHMVYLIFPFSQVLSLNYSSSLSLFSSQIYFCGGSLKRYLYYTLYIIKAKKILESLCGK
jgi:hypothetical protein